MILLTCVAHRLEIEEFEMVGLVVEPMSVTRIK